MGSNIYIIKGEEKINEVKGNSKIVELYEISRLQITQ
jgi:hypothetical protein